MSERFETIFVRGIGRTPEKTAHLVLPPDVTNYAELEAWLETQDVKAVGEDALEALE